VDADKVDSRIFEKQGEMGVASPGWMRIVTDKFPFDMENAPSPPLNHTGYTTTRRSLLSSFDVDSSIACCAKNSYIDILPSDSALVAAGPETGVIDDIDVMT
jgi:hypothetical protein